MDLTIVVPTHNRPKQLLRLIDSIKKQKCEGMQIEVIVVSNLKNSKLTQFISSFQKDCIFPIADYYVGKIGVNGARNLGLRNATANKIYFLDDDVYLQKEDHLMRLFNFVKLNPTISAIGAGYDIQENSNIIDRVYHAISSCWLAQGQSKSSKVTNLVGGNTLYNKELLKNHLTFNENIFFGGTETELNIKLNTVGHKLVYLEEFNIEHSTNLTTRELMIKAIRQGMGRSYHETLVPIDFWTTQSNNPYSFFKNNNGQHTSSHVAKIYFSLYHFFFQVGYRHGKLQNNGPLSKIAIMICLFQNLLKIRTDKVLYDASSFEPVYHLKTLPSFKSREIYHWTRAKIGWNVVPILELTLKFVLVSFFQYNIMGITASVDSYIKFIRKKLSVTLFNK